MAMRLETRFVKVSDPTAIPFQPTRDANAVKIELTEEDVLQRYPLDYTALTRKLLERYTDFKQAQNYHDLRKPLHSDPKYCKERLLDPTKPQGTKKRFYSPQVFKIFDQHYTKRP